MSLASIAGLVAIIVVIYIAERPLLRVMDEIVKRLVRAK